jgi:hypothetical protein
MRWSRFDLRQINGIDKAPVSIKQQKINEHDKLTEHPLHKNVDVVAGGFWLDLLSGDVLLRQIWLVRVHLALL